MSKKDKRKIKINHKISTYFDGDPFDVGIARVGTSTLSELFMVIGLYDIPEDRDSLIKLARNIWSEGDLLIREIILEFFVSNQKVYKRAKTQPPSVEKEQKLSETLAKFELDEHERAKLLHEFSDVRASKITYDRVASKLERIRFESKKTLLEKELEGHFNLDDRFEFNGVLEYKVFGSTFKKIHIVQTKSYDLEFLKDEPNEQIVAKIKADKLSATNQKQNELDSFLEKLSKNNRYLDKESMLKLLKATPPSSIVPNITKDILQNILIDELNLLDVKLYKDELLVVVLEVLKLPHTQTLLEYELEIHLELKELLTSIWLDEELLLKDVVLKAKDEHEQSFLNQLELLVDECKKYAQLLKLDEQTLYTKVYEHLLELVNHNLNINSKTANKTIKRFIYSIQEELLKKQRYEFLARSIRDFKSLFPLARSLRRKLTLHIGPTNSGKTYTALQKLKEANTGYYLAPLRLLALEVYEDMNRSNLGASLITGEEQILSSTSTHISSTIEMLNFDVEVDVCVIDEAQMIDDRDRGWAWVNAIIGTPAKEVILTASNDAKEAIIALAAYLNEELNIVEFSRKNPLVLLEHPLKDEQVSAGSAIVAFSRRDVLNLKQRFLGRFSVSVVYGNLSPEVRREEARRFREGESELLIATDAIAMGLNLPIKTILFSASSKFDGIKNRDITPNEIKQISGRAGRFGLEEMGYTGALDDRVLRVIKRGFNKDVASIKLPLRVMANLEHVKLISTLLEENSLRDTLEFFVKNMQFSGPFLATNLDDMLEACKIIDSFNLDIVTKYHLACAPLSLSSPYIVNVFESYLLLLENNQTIRYTPPLLKNTLAHTNDELLRAEDMVKEISLYLWLSFRFAEHFVDVQKANDARVFLNNYISKTLQSGHIRKNCRECGVSLKANSPHSICDRCFKRFYRKRVSR